MRPWQMTTYERNNVIAAVSVASVWIVIFVALVLMWRLSKNIHEETMEFFKQKPCTESSKVVPAKRAFVPHDDE